MKVQVCRSCGAQFETYAELEEHLKNHSKVCRTCKRSFSRHSTLASHICRIGEYSCESCQSSFSTEKQLKRHLRRSLCRHTLPPNPKRRKTSTLPPAPTLPPPATVEEDQEEVLLAVEDPELQNVLRAHWGSVRTYIARGPVQTRFNYRLVSRNTRSMELCQILEEQTTAFKVNLSYGFILQHRQSKRLKYYHSSCNCCGRFLDKPCLVTTAVSFDAFLESIHEQDVLKWAISKIPNSDWVCVMVTNATFFVNRILKHPIGCVGIALPPRIKQNSSIIGLEKDNHGQQYVDNLCLFRCLGLHLYRDAMTLYIHTDQPAREFEGITIDDLHKVETVFEVNIVVYELGDECSQLVRRSLGQYTTTMNIKSSSNSFFL